MTFVVLYLLFLSPFFIPSIRSACLGTEVTAYFDEFGVPHIYAESEEDAYQALYYLIAQERLFQMEMTRRIASGRLAAILGKDFLVNDRFHRTLLLKQMAEKAVAENHADTTTNFHKAANAYLQGINQYIKMDPHP